MRKAANYLSRAATIVIALSTLTFPAIAAEEKTASSVSETKEAVKDGARTVGHATRDVTRAIGHGTRDAAKAIGHGSRDAARGVGNAAKGAWREVTEPKGK